MPGLTVLFSIILVVLLIVVVLQNATRYTASDRVSDRLTGIGLAVSIFVIVFLSAWNWLHPRFGWWSRIRTVGWFVIALFCLWAAFGNDLRRPRQ